MKIKTFIFVTMMSISSLSYGATNFKNTDQYIAGYVQGLFVNSYGIPADAVRVRGGQIYIKEEQIGGNYTPEYIVEKLKQATTNLEGVKGITLIKSTGPAKALKDREDLIDGLMPDHSLFHALIADPKWPRFTLAYQYNFHNRTTRQAFAPNFGASFPIFRGVINNPESTEWEFGIQGGLFAVLDIGTNPSALINADYFIGFPFSFRSGSWSSIVRPYHVSSHLGDEFMLTKQGKNTKRINLSYEGLDVILSYNFTNGFRMYGGGGYIVHRDPDYIKRLKVQGGVEYRAQNTFWDGRLRPVTGLDVKSEQMSRWTPGISFKTGVQIENSVFISNEIQLMLEAYSGKSMNGQFYTDNIQYLGIGLHAFL